MHHGKELYSIRFEWSISGNFLRRLSLRSMLTLVELVDMLLLVKYVLIYNYTMMFQSNTKKNFIMFIIVLGQHVSTLIESSQTLTNVSVWDLTAHCKHC